MNKPRHKLRSIICSAGCLLALCLCALLSAFAQSPTTTAQTSDEDRCSKSIPAIFESVSPSVVYITASTINPYRVKDRIEHVVGTGFIIDSSGLILTNSHVAFGRQSLVVTLDDGTTLPAQLVGADPIFDIALLRIPKPTRGELAPVALGDSDHIKVGMEVLAIGNPLGLDQTLTRGVVSAINRILPQTFFSLQEPFIQMDAPINPGNSGGPLLNRCGEVIGVTTSMIPNASNIGFSIPINLAKALMPSLISEGHIVRPWLGFHGQYVDSTLQSLLRIPLVEGVMIEVVEPGSPAEKMGLHGGELEMTIAGSDFLIGGDIITAINGVAATQPEKMFDALQRLKVGDTLNLTLFREGKYLNVKYVLPERPLLPGDLPGEQLSAPLTGVSPVRSALRPNASRML
jgi:S1-C subfamily serine protease